MSQATKSLAAWIDRVTPSATAQLEQQVEAMLAEGETLLLLGLGEPDFSAPSHVKQAAIGAIEHNFSKYTATGGIMPLKRAIAQKLRESTRVVYEPDEVMATVGGKHALFNAVNVLCCEGDQVIIPMPYWVSFPEQVKFAGGEPIMVQTDAATGYKLTAEQLESLVTARTKAVILNSPNNPSGAVYSAAELSRLADVCKRHDLWVISDEVYAEFQFTPEGHCSIAAVEGMKERTIVIHSLSKGYGMTGWRLGMAAGPSRIIGAMTVLQSHTTSNPSTMVQQAAVAALTGPQDSIHAVQADYRNRREAVVEGVRQLPGISCEQPDGAFYVWADIGAWIGKQLGGRRIAGADEFCAAVLEDCRIVLMPGSAFGSSRHVRISFSASPAAIEEGLTRLKDWLTRHVQHR
ncbi:pyridoxal phosphate-dependent aminotransferase [Xylanibacillus composti]|uniref:Aminotransferase n=1 Tax=Xylanibacillus composti TaxID=1572762 RepID=A0A8J4H5B7_9BACL|nr:pyridoxal phosphate-dependent aminotransferase [Xylanibacillus composti]MDT9726475.1 pyridoxal phosphate-dependent aminotransferase [Xylanibacillus composti]GIQ69955.1 aminotransferase [Xylanibacillus composti]